MGQTTEDLQEELNSALRRAEALLDAHAAELAEAYKIADCWAKAETALNDMGMERDALRQRAEAAEAKLRAVDDVLILHHLGPRDDGDYRKALANLVAQAVGPK